MDFTSTFIEGKSLNERLEIFKSFIKGIASRWIIENGIVVVSFVEGSRQFSDDTYYNVDKYRSKFDNVDDFYMLDILPSNNKDLIIVYCNKTLGKQLLIKHDAYDFY